MFGARGIYRSMCEKADDPLDDAFAEALTTAVDATCEAFTP
ncbi:hypothetical protein [Nannocystis pusilla]